MNTPTGFPQMRAFSILPASCLLLPAGMRPHFHSAIISWKYCLMLAFCICVGSVSAQTLTLERLKEALILERKPDLQAAQLIYESLLMDPDWGAAARLSLARVQRWQYLHPQAKTNYLGVLANTKATTGMREEAILGLAQIDTLELRLQEADQRLAIIPASSTVSDQARELRSRLTATHPTRIGGNYGQVHNKGGSTDNGWQLKLTHQLDMRNAFALSYSRNSLQQRGSQPDAMLDFVKEQAQATWRYQIPLDVAYSVEATNRMLSLGTSETSLRMQGSWPIAKDWRANAGFQRVNNSDASNSSGFAGVGASITKNWQLAGNVYAAEASGGILYSWMFNTSWEQGPWLGQWFVSRTLDAPKVNHTFVVRQRVSGGPTWRTELRRDQHGNTAIIGLDIPWGKHVTSASVQSSPFANQWSVGFDYAWPNGLAKVPLSAP
jgi:hypothetical protein